MILQWIWKRKMNNESIQKSSSSSIRKKYLADALSNSNYINIFLTNGNRLKCKILEFDGEVIKFSFFDKETNQKGDQIINYHAIATIRCTKGYEGYEIDDD